ncbi:MAG TPA: trypsin-like peptidase domain-containing protein [Methylomirabilota bacterium]|nr:trypsin-like peptidase domain-containing protein [Methylomirabilota bacterium]
MSVSARSKIALALATSLFTTASADVIQLRDNASVTGKILTQKKDQVAVDIGYTVLVIPRQQITKITTGEEASAATVTQASAKPLSKKAALIPEATPTVATAKTLGTPTFYESGNMALQEKSVKELVEQLGESVVQVRTPGGLGSGFFVNDEGYLITNFHVIEGETQISIEVYHQKNGQLDRRSYKQVRIVAMNKYVDLALLKVEDDGAPKFRTAPLGDAESLGVGERVFAIGSPLGLERTVTEGILSTKTRQMQGELYLQTTAQINPGNSGGPLFNLRGEVVGVTNMKITFGEGLGFAIPIEEVKFFLRNRDAYAYDNDNPSNAFRYLEPPRRTAQAAAKAAPEAKAR